MKTKGYAMRAIFQVGLLALLCVGAFAQKKSAKPKPAADAVITKAPEMINDDYVIGPEDILSINVWKEPEITRLVPVRPDGKISLPLIGDIEAAKSTPTQLQVRLTKALQAFIANPVVTVIVQDVKSQKFNVMGQVSRPGSFQLVKPMTVLDALAFAGGFREFANTSRIYVLRVMPDGSRARLKFDYKKVVKGQNSEQNVELETRDTIVVP